MLIKVILGKGKRKQPVYMWRFYNGYKSRDQCIVEAELF